MDIFDGFFDFNIPGEIIISISVMVIISILSLITFFLAKKADPKKEHKGLLGLMEMAVEKVDSMVLENMGNDFPNLVVMF